VYGGRRWRELYIVRAVVWRLGVQSNQGYAVNGDGLVHLPVCWSFWNLVAVQLNVAYLSVPLTPTLRIRVADTRAIPCVGLRASV